MSYQMNSSRKHRFCAEPSLAFQSWRDRSIRPTCSTKCSLFSLLNLHVCTPSNFFTTILIYNCWLFPPQIHWLRNRLHRLFRCALKKFSPNETVWRSENMIIIIILVIQDSSLFLAFFSRDFSYQYALPWTGSNLYSKKECKNKA